MWVSLYHIVGVVGDVALSTIWEFYAFVIVLMELYVDQVLHIFLHCLFKATYTIDSGGKAINRIVALRYIPFHNVWKKRSSISKIDSRHGLFSSASSHEEAIVSFMLRSHGWAGGINLNIKVE